MGSIQLFTCWYRMYISIILLGSFCGLLIPVCHGKETKCKDHGQINGQIKTTISWKCFKNSTMLCTTSIIDCSKCDNSANWTTTSISKPKTGGGKTEDSKEEKEKEDEKKDDEKKDDEKKEDEKKDDESKEDEKKEDEKKENEKQEDEKKDGKGHFPTCEDVCSEDKDFEQENSGELKYSEFEKCEGGSEEESK